MKKLRVGIIYGGRSGEHEVSLASAASVFANLDPERYEAVAIRIEKDGRWTLPSAPPKVMKAADVIKGALTKKSHAGLQPPFDPAQGGPEAL
jgi:D-alanine-D-alanine ligase